MQLAWDCSCFGSERGNGHCHGHGSLNLDLFTHADIGGFLDLLLLSLAQ
jgi:hypothetical protein